MMGLMGLSRSGSALVRIPIEHALLVRRLRECKDNDEHALTDPPLGDDSDASAHDSMPELDSDVGSDDDSMPELVSDDDTWGLIIMDPPWNDVGYSDAEEEEEDWHAEDARKHRGG